MTTLADKSMLRQDIWTDSSTVVKTHTVQRPCISAASEWYNDLTTQTPYTCSKPTLRGNVMNSVRSPKRELAATRSPRTYLIGDHVSVSGQAGCLRNDPSERRQHSCVRHIHETRTKESDKADVSAKADRPKVAEIGFCNARGSLLKPNASNIIRGYEGHKYHGNLKQHSPWG